MDFAKKKIPDLLWVSLIAAISLVIHFLTYNTLGFHRDEYLYMSLGKHPDAGYWSNPPLIGLISYISQLLPGNALFNTRLLPAIAGAVLIFLTGLSAREMGGKTYAQVLSCIALLASIVFLRAFSMLQPVPFDILFWTLILYLALRYVNTENPRFLILIGIVFGLGILNKYMVVFLAAGLAIGILPTLYRKLWISKYSGYAILATLLLALPNIWWQYTHGFPVFHHMKELAETQLVHVKRLNFLTDQLLMFTVSSVVWLAGLIWLLRSDYAKKYRLIGYTYLAVLFMLFLLHGKSYYMAGMYPVLFAAGGVSMEGKILKPGWRILLPAAIVLLTIPVIPGAIPVMSAGDLARYFSKIPPAMGGEALVRWEDGKMHPLPQDFADMQGWDELGQIVVKAYDSIREKQRIMIYCQNYGQAGAVDFWGKRHNLPQTISFSDNYLLWAPDTISRNKDIFIYVNSELGKDVNALFDKIYIAGSITNRYAREYHTTVFICTAPRSDFSKFWAERVKAVKRDAGILRGR